MKQHWHFLVCGAMILAIIIFSYFGSEKKNAKPQQTDNQSREQRVAETPSEQWETKTDEQGQVVVVVTPVELGKDAKVWKFAIVLDTHSVDLNQDLIKVSLLFDDKGNVYQSTSWEGSLPGGHHREGTLMFDALQPTPPSIELKINGIGGVSERSFKWEIK